MMKKTLCLFLVLALVAQICARPDGKDDAEEAAKETADKATKEGKDKAHKASEKGQAEAKAFAKKGKEVSDDLQEKGKAGAEQLEEHAKDATDGRKPKHHGLPHLPLSAMIREAEKTGEKMFESGTNAFVNFMKKMGM